MDSIRDFFPKGCDPERSVDMSTTDVEWTISMLMDILQHVFRDGIDVEKCPNCEPADKKILDHSFATAGRDANVKDDNICQKCGKPKIKTFKLCTGSLDVTRVQEEKVRGDFNTLICGRHPLVIGVEPKLRTLHDRYDSLYYRYDFPREIL